MQYIDRQRNVVGTYTRTVSPRLIFESLISITRSTPGFPTTDYTDPAVKFNDGLFEAFNSAAGIGDAGLWQSLPGPADTSHSRCGNHAFKAGFEARLNRDTTYFGISPNGEYDFGGGTAYATEAIPSASGTHNIALGDPLARHALPASSPAVRSSTLSAIAPPYFSGGAHIGPAAISRNNFNVWAQDTWKVTPRFTLDYGVRWELYTPITERARRTGGFPYINGAQEYVVNPQPGYQTDWHGFRPARAGRVAGYEQALGACRRRQSPSFRPISGRITSSPAPRLLPSIRACSPRPHHPFQYGFKITPAQLPDAYTPGGHEYLRLRKDQDRRAQHRDGCGSL